MPSLSLAASLSICLFLSFPCSINCFPLILLHLCYFFLPLSRFFLSFLIRSLRPCYLFFCFFTFFFFLHSFLPILPFSLCLFPSPPLILLSLLCPYIYTLSFFPSILLSFFPSLYHHLVIFPFLGLPVCWLLPLHSSFILSLYFASVNSFPLPFRSLPLPLSRPSTGRYLFLHLLLHSPSFISS